MKKYSKSMMLIALFVILGLWLASGVYTLKADGGEKAVVTRFGKYVRTEEEAGLKWHLPAPIERVEIIKSDLVRSIEIGFKTSVVGSPYKKSQYVDNPTQSLMITGDENLVHTEMVVQYRIPNVKNYLFNVDDQEETLFIAAESAIRRIVANHSMDDVLTNQKETIQAEVKLDLQKICDEYGLGIMITQVVLQAVYAPSEVDEAFKDVIKAREDMSRYINEAKRDLNKIVPAAQGKAAEMINQANAYKEKRISEAKGDVAAFKKVLEKYKLGKEVTRTRMYLETMKEVLPGAKIYIVDDKGNTLKFLPLDGVTKIQENK